MKKLILFLMCFMIAIQLQAATVNMEMLKIWSSSKKMDQPITREECRYLLEATFGKTLNRQELTMRPKEIVTREEMALMIVHLLGYEDIANKLKSVPTAFKDIHANSGAINLVKDLKLINGDSASSFNPQKKLTYQEVLTITNRIAEKLKTPIDEIHSSYAIKSSEQIMLMSALDSVSFGWSQVEYDTETKQVVLNTSPSDKNNFSIPLGFEMPLGLAKQQGLDMYLMVYLEDRPIAEIEDGNVTTLAAYIFSHEAERQLLIKRILDTSRHIAQEGGIDDLDGITIDFEGFYNASLKEGFNVFLSELKEALTKENKKLNVAVQPKDYYKGYDYKTIGQLADRVILMAHDYSAKTLTEAEMQSGFAVTPITPIHAIYSALKDITDENSGMNPEKVMLQMSFASTQWQIKDNKIINQKPYTPSYDKIYARLQNQGTELTYSDVYQNPYAVYYDGGVRNVIWYENDRSIEAKIDLAKMFGVTKISLWRLGTIPHYENANEKIGLDIVSLLSTYNK